MSRSHVLVALVAGLAVNAVLALTSACAPASLQDAASTRSTAIVDGQLATEDQVGATVSLLMFGESSCTGTLIAPRVVATAAHCLSGVNESELQIVVRSTVPAENGIRLPVESLTPHPEYASFGIPCDDPAGLCDERDIGVVVLAQGAPVSPAPPLALDDVDNRLHDGVDVVIAGYGLTEFSEDGDYGRLYIARTPFIRRSEAEILAGRPGSPDSCNGDSGGPAYVEIDGVLHLAGITSRASLESFEPCGEGGIYTLFPAFASFVEEASGGLFDGDGGSVDLPPPPPPPEGAGSCARACNAAPPDQSCFCDSFCMAAGDCCEDFNAECPEVPEWTCSLE